MTTFVSDKPRTETLDRTDLILADKSRPASKRSVLGLPFDRINWITSSFLIGTLVLTLTAVPLYLWFFGLDWFQVALFFAMLWACGFSITVGYHRLFSHLTFQASWPIRLLTLIFGITSMWIMTMIRIAFRKAFFTHTSAGCFLS
jgi:fatty-acid desaturase